MEKIIQPLGTRTIWLVKNVFIGIVRVQLVNVARLVDEFNPRETRRVIRIGVQKRNLLCQLIGRP